MMEGLNGRARGPLRGNAGFTLIEMAIVLIIIGIIIGAVVKGKDLVRSAEQKRLYTTWLREWQLAYNNYYDRTGRILGDINDSDNGVTSGATRDGHCSNPSEANLQSQLDAVGLKAPAKGPNGHITQRTYTDSSGHMYTMYINFYYTSSTGNYIAVRNVPYDLGMAWDRIIDGEMDGANGDFLYAATWTNPGSGGAWPSATGTTSTTEAGILKLQF